MKKTSLLLTIAVILAASAIIGYRAEKKIVLEAENNTVIVGTNAEFPPFSFKEGDIITGFDIDVVTEVLNRLNKTIVFKDMPFDALIPEVQLGNIQVIAAGITPTPERAQRALFTRPHLTGNPLIIISPKPIFGGTSSSPLDALIGKTVVVNEGYVADSFMSEQPGVNLLRLPSASVSDGIFTILSGNADAFVTATFSMKPYFEKYNIKDFFVATIPGTEETSAFAVSKHYPQLRDYMQATLDRMEDDGTLDALKKKWNLL